MRAGRLHSAPHTPHSARTGGVTPRGFDAPSESTLLSSSLVAAGATGDAESDPPRLLTFPGPELAAVVAAWPARSEPIRRAILALTSEAKPRAT